MLHPGDQVLISTHGVLSVWSDWVHMLMSNHNSLNSPPLSLSLSSTLTGNFSDKNCQEFAAHSAHINPARPDNHLAGIWFVAYSNLGISLVHLSIPSSHVLTALECTFKVIIQECTLCTIGRHNGLKTEFWSIKPNHQTHDLDMLQLSYLQKSKRICCNI